MSGHLFVEQAVFSLSQAHPSIEFKILIDRSRFRVFLLLAFTNLMIFQE
jgi:hypothetical protein